MTTGFRGTVPARDFLPARAAVRAAALALAGVTAAGCAAGVAPDGTAAAPVRPSGAAAEAATVFPVVGNAADLTVEPAVTAGRGLPPTRLTVQDLVVGDGAQAGLHDAVVVNYVGTVWETAAVFDATWAVGEPRTLALDQVIAGLSQGIGGSASDGVEGMRVGGRRMLVIPPRLGFGPSGGQGDVKVDDTIVMVVDLLAVNPAPEATASPTSPAEGL